MKKVVALLLVLALTISSLVGCSGAKEETTETTGSKEETTATVKEETTETKEETTATVQEETTTEKKVVAYSIPSMFTTFFAACWQGFEQQAEALGWEAVLLDPNGDINLQISQLKNQVTQGVDAICISPIDSEAIGPALTECANAGVPVFCIDRRGSGKVVSTLETDNVAVGVAMGDKILTDYNGKDIDVLIVQGVLSDTPTLDRTAGVKMALEGHDNVAIIGEPSAGAYSNEAAMSTTKTYLESNPDLDVIFTCTDALVPGILAALKEAGKTALVGEDGHIGVYSVDGAGETLDYIAEGSVDATFSQYPITLGTDVIKTMEEYFAGTKVEEKIYYSGDVVSQSNIEMLKDTLWGYIVK
ncbi:MAG: sugar ABC transporter substrate-binding protein [Lachnospiraceae bacterium]|nr:sugar ABC transporter substrate-binding protein [Lachnospiraceae bacterium]